MMPTTLRPGPRRPHPIAAALIAAAVAATAVHAAPADAEADIAAAASVGATDDGLGRLIQQQLLDFPARAGASVAGTVAQVGAGLGAAGRRVQRLGGGLRDAAAELAMSAMSFIGVPYRLGGNTAETGFDCSGFTRFIFDKVGLALPRRADEQATTAKLLPIGRSELKPGDLVFFNTMRRTFSHVGIYLGDQKFIHAPRTGTVVRVDDMRTAYWDTRFTGARRALADDGTPVDAQALETALAR